MQLSTSNYLTEIRGNRLGSITIDLVSEYEEVESLLKEFDKMKEVTFDLETESADKVGDIEVFIVSFATLPTQGYVIPVTIDTLNLIFNWLVNTKVTIIAHNLTYDMRFVHKHTGKFIENYEDTYLMSKTLNNFVSEEMSHSLKALTKHVFGEWAEDVTNLDESCKTDKKILFYAGVDSCSCYYLYSTLKGDYTPIDLEEVLPIKHPSKIDVYTNLDFYNNISKQLIPLVIEMKNNGVPVDVEGAINLYEQLDSDIETLYEEVQRLPTVIKSFNEIKKNKANIQLDKSKEKFNERVFKPVGPTNTKYKNLFIDTHFDFKPSSKTSKNWTKTALKGLLGENHIVTRYFDKDLAKLRNHISYKDSFDEVERILVNDKETIERKKFEATFNQKLDSAESKVNFKPFNSDQKRYIINKGFNLRSTKKSMDTGEDSFDREEMTHIMNSTKKGSELNTFAKLNVDYSVASIIKSAFSKKIADNATKEGYIHSNFNLHGTLTFRLTSNGHLNFLQIPNKKNKFSKKVKSLFRVPNDDWVMLTADFSALEEVIMANVTKDPNKITVLEADSHIFHTCYYYTDRVEELLGRTHEPTQEYVNYYQSKMEEIPELDDLRSQSKPFSFSLAYGSGIPGLYRSAGYLDKTFEDEIYVGSDTSKFTLDVEPKRYRKKNGKQVTFYTAKKNATWYSNHDYKKVITKKEHINFFEKAVIPATIVFERYHKELYPGIRSYNEKVKINQIKPRKEVHGLLGLTLKTTQKVKSATIRTMTNFLYQSFSLLSILALERFRRRVYEKGWQEHIKIQSSVYDSVYLMVKNDRKYIDWTVETLGDLMTQDFIEDQKVKLKAEFDISYSSWADFKPYKKEG
jgi:DNA polymerase I-like protein with 3'-5' exonuclease and polymerase domains